MRIMAIDYGDARTGIAFSDPTGMIPGETAVLPSYNGEKLFAELCRNIRERQVGVVALGLPKNMDGSEGPRAEKSRALAERLRGEGFTVELVDERRTTVEAHAILSEAGRHGKERKQRIDAVAATLILETFLGKFRIQNSEFRIES